MSVQRETAVTAANLLEALGSRLRAEGWKIALSAPQSRPPTLEVGNPAVPMMCDRIMAALMADGSWWFWWSFGERISNAADLDSAVRKIGNVLGFRPARPRPWLGI